MHNVLNNFIKYLLNVKSSDCQWRSQRGGVEVQLPPIRIEAVFFTAVKSLLLNIIASL